MASFPVSAKNGFENPRITSRGPFPELPQDVTSSCPRPGRALSCVAPRPVSFPPPECVVTWRRAVFCSDPPVPMLTARDSQRSECQALPWAVLDGQEGGPEATGHTGGITELGLGAWSLWCWAAPELLRERPPPPRL